MRDEADLVVVTLTYDEACELLTRCLESQGEDTAVFRDALQRLARAIEPNQRNNRQAA
ncbi:hypothetical protein QPK87_19235 [Kamptonema cortianum]|nr:hypothetical protein [Geitlerinema splendidum]MDK3158690.1 hypothetical protein [Kamptonema cortianum]